MRCIWAERSDIERDFHDREWGVPIHDDRRLFEQLTLRGAQAGLSFRTVLSKREGYRETFHGYDIARIAAMPDVALDALLLDRRVIRHRLKLQSVRTNARALLRMSETGKSLCALFWAVVDGVPQVNPWDTEDAVPARTPASDWLSVELRLRGFRYAGSAICYSIMQSAGMVDDHVRGCRTSERRRAP